MLDILKVVRERKKMKKLLAQGAVLLSLAIILTTIITSTSGVYAEDINIEKLADAIYRAEGGENTNYPYGILQKYEHTTPRQACINTIRHGLKDWDGEGDFISFLGSRYAPLGVENDPRGLNKFWIGNVKFYYERKPR